MLKEGDMVIDNNRTILRIDKIFYGRTYAIIELLECTVIMIGDNTTNPVGGKTSRLPADVNKF
jgi:hypothetical protein